MPPADTSASLSVGRSRSRRWLLGTGVVLLVGAGLAWYVTHPGDLPTSDNAVQATTPAGSPIYVGVYAPDPEDGGTLEVRDLDVEPLTEDPPVSVIPLVCKDGSIAVTSSPATFCGRLVRAEGETVGPGDELVLQLFGDVPGTVELDRVRLSFREGARWGTSEVGPPIVATFLGG